MVVYRVNVVINYIMKTCPCNIQRLFSAVKNENFIRFFFKIYLDKTLIVISKYFLSRYEDDLGDFIDRGVTQDETCVHHFDPESKM